MRGALALLVGPILGETTPHMPLFVVEALVVEAIAFRVLPDERPLAFGLWAGVGIGTVGLASEWGWTHAWMPLPWPSELFPEAALLGFAAAVSGALLGAWAGSRLSLDPAPGLPSLRRAAVVGAAGVAALVAFALYKPADQGVTARVALTDVQGGAQRTVNADVRLSPAGAADDAEWLTATAWQGDGLVVDRLRKVGPGHYRTTEPIPVNGNWKSLIRLHHGNSLTAVPVFLPRDQAIPAKEVPGAGGVHPHVRGRPPDPPARAEGGGPRADRGRLPGGGGHRAGAAGRCWSGACTAWPRPGPRTRPPRAPREAAPRDAGAGGQPCLTWRSRWPTTPRSRPCPSSGRCC